MATVNVVLTKVEGYDDSGRHVIPVPAADYKVQENFTSSGTSQATTAAAAGRDEVWCVTVSGGDVYVSVGSSPTAASGTGWLIKDGVTWQASAEADQKLALIDA